MRRPFSTRWRDADKAAFHRSNVVAVGMDGWIPRGQLPYADLVELRDNVFAALVGLHFMDLAGVPQAQLRARLDIFAIVCQLIFGDENVLTN